MVRIMNLLLGDCLEQMQTIPDKSIDLVLTDLPYGASSQKWDSIIPLEPMWKEINRIKKPNCACVFTAIHPFTSMLVMSNLKDFKYSLVWSKNKGSGHLNAKKMPMRYHEDILVFYSKQPTYNPQMTTNHSPMHYAKNTRNASFYNLHEPKVTEGGKTIRHPRSILEFPVVNNDGSTDGGRFHPSQKPLQLLEYLIKTYSNEGDLVLDVTMGSGSTGVAARNLNRKFIGIENNEKYFEIAKKRILDTN